MGPRRLLGRRRRVVASVAAAWPWRRRCQSSGEREVPTAKGDASLKSGVRAVRVAGVPVANIHSGGVGVHHPATAVAAAAGTCAVLLAVVVRLVRELAAAASEDMKSTMAKDLASSAKVKGTAPETLSERVVVCAGRVEAAGGKIPTTVGNWKPGAGRGSSGSTAGMDTSRKTTKGRGRRERHWKSRPQRYSSRPGAGAGEAGAAGSAAGGAHAAVGGGDERGP